MSRHLRQLKDESNRDYEPENIEEEIESRTNNFLNLVPKSATLCNNTFLNHLDNFEVLKLNGSLEYRLRNPSSASQPLPLKKGRMGRLPLLLSRGEQSSLLDLVNKFLFLSHPPLTKGVPLAAGDLEAASV